MSDEDLRELAQAIGSSYEEDPRALALDLSAWIDRLVAREKDLAIAAERKRFSSAIDDVARKHGIKESS